MTDESRIVPFSKRRRKRRGCPLCGSPVAPAHAPFCSARCAQIDLGRWLKEGYRIPTEEAPSGMAGNPDEED